MHNKLFLAIVIGALVAVSVFSQFVTHVATDYLARHENTAEVVQCQGTHASHDVIISDGEVTPEHTEAAVCDTLMIHNSDDVLRLMAFGTHDHHEPYDGVSETALEKGQSFSVTLNQAGTYIFHDHLHDEVQATFTVTD